MKQNQKGNCAERGNRQKAQSTRLLRTAQLSSRGAECEQDSGMKKNTANGKDFEARVLPELKDLYCTALYVLDNESDAQDLVQESFARAYRSWHKSQINQNCRVWLFGIMGKILINRYRSSCGVPVEVTDADDIDGYLIHSRSGNRQPIDYSEQVPFSTISIDDVKNAIRNLPDNFRLIVVLSLLEDFSYQEIADIAGINLETVRSRLYHGRKLMQREICDHVACESSCSMTADRVRSRNTG
jgi:RNA polymerase sigma-70 factor (ECF subfamily)